MGKLEVKVVNIVASASHGGTVDLYLPFPLLLP